MGRVSVVEVPFQKTTPFSNRFTGDGHHAGCRTSIYSETMSIELEKSPNKIQLESDVRWWVLHTKSRQEKALASDLEARGFSHFLPLITTVRYYGRRKTRSQVPLFPGYVFLRGEIESVFAADRTDRVAGVIRVADQERLERDLSHIKRTIECGGSLVPMEGLSTGCWVEVKSGPFKGIIGRIWNQLPGDRLALNVEMIGRAAVLEIDRSLLAPMT